MIWQKKNPVAVRMVKLIAKAVGACALCFFTLVSTIVCPQIKKEDILYVEAVGKFGFAYTKQDIYQMKSRLYEVEEQFYNNFFIRCSKSVLVNLNKLSRYDRH
ncbi:MAG: LytTR family transcriptional regulator [Lachnospiraceae bacterium]|nr:LytTR family transcriptional regulator [Lachnospiraceae bacterium]